MISLLLVKQIANLFLILAAGFLLVKSSLLAPEESRGLSIVCLYLSVPCVMLRSFQMENTPEVRSGLLLALGGAVAAHILLIGGTYLQKGPLGLSALEEALVIYTNAGNLIVPIVAAVLGEEWLIYASAYMSVQIVLVWTHLYLLFLPQRRVSLLRVLCNPSVIAIIGGLFLFVTGVRLSGIVNTALASVGGMAGPLGMLITGMLIGRMNLRQIFAGRRVYRIVLLRMAVMPLLCTGLMILLNRAFPVRGGAVILLISLLACITPPAATVTQMAQLCGADAEYASVGSVLSTLVCILTIPAIVFAYQFVCPL